MGFVPNGLLELYITFFYVTSATVKKFGFQNIEVNTIVLYHYHRSFKGMKTQTFENAGNLYKEFFDE
jgi:hypothetical protein